MIGWTWFAASYKTNGIIVVNIERFQQKRVWFCAWKVLKNNKPEYFQGRLMSKLKKVILMMITVALAAGTVFLMTWDIPAPSENVSKTLSNDRFPS